MSVMVSGFSSVVDKVLKIDASSILNYPSLSVVKSTIIVQSSRHLNLLRGCKSAKLSLTIPTFSREFYKY